MKDEKHREQEVKPVLTIHRSATEIGGNCIEIAFGKHRILLDVGKPLEPDPLDATDHELLPDSLDLSRPFDAVILSHPHMDHYGLLRALPDDVPVWSGAPTERLIRMTLAISGRKVPQTFHHYESFEPFQVGPFTITPFLTDHSAFDAHMLLVEVGGKRIFYSGDFRRTGRKASLVRRFLTSPPAGIDVLLLEGTALGRERGYPTERALENRFIDLFRRIPGRVFVTWSAQNIDRTVTLYHACKAAGRTLIVDLYTAGVLEQVGIFGSSLLDRRSQRLKFVVTAGNAWLYENPKRLNDPAFFRRCRESGRAFSARKLQGGPNRNVIMIRPGRLLRDYQGKGVVPSKDDAWSLSMWSGYLTRPDYPSFRELEQWFKDAGSHIEHIHTSGHASKAELLDFANRLAPRHLIPIHSFDWDKHLGSFSNVTRLMDGESFEIKQPDNLHRIVEM